MATLVLFLALIALVVMGAIVLQGRLQFGYIVPSATAEAAAVSRWMERAKTPEKRLALACWLTRQRRRHSPEFQAAKAARKLARSQQSAADKAAWQAGAERRRLLAEQAKAVLEAEAYEAWLEANPQSCGLDFRAHDRWVRKSRRQQSSTPRSRPTRARRVKPVLPATQVPTPVTAEVTFEVLYPTGGKTYAELRAQQFAWAKAREERRAFARAEAARRERRAADREWRQGRRARRQAVSLMDPSLLQWQARVQQTLEKREAAEQKAAQLEKLQAEAARLDAMTLLERKRSEAARKGWETRRRNAEMAAAAAGVLH